MPRPPLLATAGFCAVALLCESGCAGDAATRYKGRVLAGPAAVWRVNHDATDRQPPVANALVLLGVASKRDPAEYCASLARTDSKRAGPTPDAVWTLDDGSFDVVTYYGGLWPLPMPDHTYLCVYHPDYEPFVYTAQPPDRASTTDGVLKLYVKPRFRGDPHPLVGMPAPPFRALSVDGVHEVALAPAAAKVTVVHFCATWCEPCKKTLPALEALSAKYQSAGLEVIAVDEDDDRDGSVAALGSKFAAAYPMAWDEKKEIATNWKPRLMPATFIVDRQGIVRFAHLTYAGGMWTGIEMEVVGLLEP